MKVDLNRPMKEILAQLSQYPVSTRLSLTGTIIVGRDIAHAKLKLIDAGKELPQYIKDHPIPTTRVRRKPLPVIHQVHLAQPPQAVWTQRGFAAIPRWQHDHAGER